MHVSIALYSTNVSSLFRIGNMNPAVLAVRTHGLMGSILAYLTLAAALFAMLFRHIGIVPTLQVSASLILVGVLPGAAFVRHLFPHPSLLHYAIIGAVTGLGLWSVGGLFSHLTGVFWVRWIPVIAGLALGLLPRRRFDDRVLTDRRDFPTLGVVGSGFGLIALLPSVRTVLQSQPSQWTGWHHFYIDLPFQIAMTSEVAARSPQAYPWVTDIPLSYPWLYHSAMGVWASTTNAAAADVVLQAWPVLFAILIPAMVSIIAWEITGNKYVAMGSPLVYVLAHGLVLTPGRLESSAIFQISPTKDFADLFILLTVLSLIRLLGNSKHCTVNPWWFLMLGFSTFIATGAKGSATPILLGGVLCVTLVLILLRRFRVPDLLALGIFAVAAASSFLLILPDRGGGQRLSWGPLTFLNPSTPARGLVSIIILATLVFAILGVWVIIGRSDSGGWLISSLVFGVTAAGLIGLGLLSHPGVSQLYFWRSAQPLFAIALTWAGTILIGEYGEKLVFAMLSIFFLSNVLWLVTQRVAVVGISIVAMALFATAVLKITTSGPLVVSRPRSWFSSIGVAIAFAAVLTQSAQMVTIPTGTSGGFTSNSDDPGAIDATQLAAFQFIRSHSTPADKVITNKHCIIGTLDHSCDARWFAVAAWAERRVLVEGWRYTATDTLSNRAKAELDLGDRFISSPTVADKLRLQSLGVKYVYVDRRNPYANHLASVAQQVYASEWANVYSLQ